MLEDVITRNFADCGIRLAYEKIVVYVQSGVIVSANLPFSALHCFPSPSLK